MISAPMPDRGYKLTSGKLGAYAAWEFWRRDMRNNYLEKNNKRFRDESRVYGPITLETHRDRLYWEEDWKDISYELILRYL